MSLLHRFQAEPSAGSFADALHYVLGVLAGVVTVPALLALLLCPSEAQLFRARAWASFRLLLCFHGVNNIYLFCLRGPDWRHPDWFFGFVLDHERRPFGEYSRNVAQATTGVLWVLLGAVASSRALREKLVLRIEEQRANARKEGVALML
eukprot:4750438-Prymnesium_polylepis.1